MKFTYSLLGHDITTQPLSTLGSVMDYMHIHDCYEISLCSEGEMELFSGASHISLRAPFLRVHMPYTFHRVEPKRDVRCTRVNAYFTEECLLERGCRLVDLKRICPPEMAAYSLTPEQAVRLEHMFEAVVSASDSRTRRFLLAAILNEMEALSAVKPAPAAAQKYSNIGDVIHYINENYMQPLNSRELAAQHFISVAKLDRDFKTYTQTTVRNFIIRVRLKKAASLLVDHSVADAAFKSGFNDVSHFIRTFHAHYHQSPLQYEKARREAENI